MRFDRTHRRHAAPRGGGAPGAPSRSAADRRRGFTLVEMLITIAIITALLGLVAVVAPRFGERQGPSRGAMQLQSWLMIAKQRALRDQRPRGIRLPPVSNPSWPAGVAYVTELQYIETPEVFSGGQLWVPDPTVSAVQPMVQNQYQFVLLQGVELGDPVLNTADPTKAPFSMYDLLDPGEDFGSEADRMRRIVQISWLPGGTSCRMVLDRPLRNIPPNTTPTPPAPTEHYRIIRANRPIPGEPLLTLPKDVGIDISRDITSITPLWYRLYPPTANNGGNQPFDILFDPSGRVVGNESTLGNRICLWVRDISANFPPTQLPDGDNTLITIYTRNGQIAAHPVDPTGLVPNTTPNQNPPSWNPFRFTQDGRSSGF